MSSEPDLTFSNKVHPFGTLDTHRLLVEPACAAALAPLFAPQIFQELDLDIQALDGPIVVIVCGGSGVTLDQVSAWKSEVGL